MLASSWRRWSSRWKYSSGVAGIKVATTRESRVRPTLARPKLSARLSTAGMLAAMKFCFSADTSVSPRAALREARNRSAPMS